VRREIRILSDDTINKVAAGEVVERPAAALKELVENSIDAGASRIDIKIEKAGKKLIRVVDDGRGMSHDDILLALERHSTSKISDAADLERVGSFGFRGEALPSMAAVSRMQIVSRPRGSDEGTRVEIVSGKIASVTPCGAPTGTGVDVRSLFRSVPARLKFLRTDTTETSHCVAAVSQLALANPRVAFTMDVGGRNVLRLDAAENPGRRLKDYLGEEVFDAFVPVSASEGDTSFEGYLSRPGRGRSGTEYQSLFVNRRPVRDHIIQRAVRETWRRYSLGGDPAAFFLWLTIPPGEVDVNVHPTKREIRFRRPSPVTALLTAAMEDALRGERPAATFAVRPPVAGEQPPPYTAVPPEPLQLPMEERGTAPEVVPPQQPMLQVLSTYLALADEEGLLLVDQHAAHERVMYERILAGFDRAASQQLLQPAVVDVTAAEAEVLEEMAGSLSGYGIAVEAFGPRSFRITALPPDLRIGEAEAFVREIIEGLRAGRLPLDDPGWLRERAALAACHASVRASQRMSPPQVRELMNALFACENPAACPHGRPTYIRIDRAEIEKRFRRIP
jgi:DNA mismatch repair protein MutL